VTVAVPTIDASVELPVHALAAVADWSGAGELHVALQPEPVWRSPGEGAELSRSAGMALVAAGLMSGPSTVEQSFLDLLPLLTMPVTEVFGWFTVDGEVVSALAAAGAMDAVIAVRAGDLVRLTVIPRDGLVESLVAALPPAPPAGGSMLTVHGDEIAALREPAEATARTIPRHVTDLLRIIDLPVLGSGELYTAERDPLGRRTVRGPLRYADTERGRYLNYARGSGPSLELTFAPGTPQALVAALGRVEIRGRTGHDG
jgi:ESX secretion-associated protein EspG